MSIAAGLGLFEFPFSSARAFWRWVELCEAGGVDSLWQSDRLIVDTPMLECMSTMAALAGATRRIKFGMNVASVALRDPFVLARQCATIDMLSDGRLLPAFGIGSPLSSDWRGTGTPTAGRGARTDEALQIMSRLWAGERLTFHGRYYQCEEAVIAPLPAQKKLPLWIGGASTAAIRRTARIGTGWMGGRETPSQAAQIVAAIKSEAAAMGRRVPGDHYGVGVYYRLGDGENAGVVRELEKLRQRFPDRDPMRTVVIGGVDDLLARLSEYAHGGVTKFVLRPLADGDDDMMRQTRAVIDQVLPRLSDIECD